MKSWIELRQKSVKANVRTAELICQLQLKGALKRTKKEGNKWLGSSMGCSGSSIGS